MFDSLQQFYLSQPFCLTPVEYRRISNSSTYKESVVEPVPAIALCGGRRRVEPTADGLWVGGHTCELFVWLEHEMYIF